jgi:hypothetical protein
MLTLTLRDRLWAAYVAMAENCENMAETIELALKDLADMPSVDAGRLCWLTDQLTQMDEEALRCRGIADALAVMGA